MVIDRGTLELIKTCHEIKTDGQVGCSATFRYSTSCVCRETRAYSLHDQND